jgi:AcrR family transcriptional regulator
MAGRDAPRPGGRSARVQAAVHDAVRALLEQTERAQITIPMIAQRAGVTPSTIYRRWGDLLDLLADVSLQRMQPEAAPRDTGTLEGDLNAWFEQYADEIATVPGRQMLKDVLATVDDGLWPLRCAALTRLPIEVILGRASARGQNVPPVTLVQDMVLAPIIYRILFSGDPVGAGYCAQLVARCLSFSTRSGG